MKAPSRLHRLPFSLAASFLLASGALAQTEVWFGESLTATWDSTNAVASDGVGGAFTGGVYTPNHFIPPFDTWIARSDDKGQPLWRVEFGDPSINGLSTLVPDGNQGVFAAGYTFGDLAGSGNSGISDFWLAHYDGAGNRSWIRQYGGADDDYAVAGTPDGAGGVFLCGRTLIHTGGLTQDAWVARFDGQGQELWTLPLATNRSDQANDITTDGQGGVFVGGFTQGPLGGVALGDWDAWLVRVDPGGNPIWTRQFGSSTSDQANVVVSDGAGGAFIAGVTSGSLMGPFAGATDAWVARYDGAGTELWARQLGSTAEDSALDGAVDKTGGLYLTGRSTGDFGAGGAAAGTAWTAHLDADGSFYWIRQYGEARSLFATATAVTDEGGVLLAGSRDAPVAVPTEGFNPWVMRFDDIGTRSFCGPAVPNSSGSPASLQATGSSVVLANEVNLIANDLPQATFGYFVVSQTQGAPTTPAGSQGNLCLASAIGRYVGPGQVLSSGTDGSFALAIDLAAIPQPLGPLQGMPGDTWSFQAWFRDANPAATSNFTDGLAVTLR